MSAGIRDTLLLPNCAHLHCGGKFDAWGRTLAFLSRERNQTVILTQLMTLWDIYLLRNAQTAPNYFLPTRLRGPKVNYCMTHTIPGSRLCRFRATLVSMVLAMLCGKFVKSASVVTANQTDQDGLQKRLFSEEWQVSRVDGTGCQHMSTMPFVYHGVCFLKCYSKYKLR